jgi:S1-C subfamily serine protease
MSLISQVLLTTTRIVTFDEQQALTNASGFFFERGERLYLVTSRHVAYDEPSAHSPSRLEIELHTNIENLAEAVRFSIPLYADGKGVWRESTDSAGWVDIAVIEIDATALPSTVVYRAFTPRHLIDVSERVEVGTPLLIVGFPLGFQDTLHYMPVARHAVVASSFGLRFQGQGYFLTDARTHRGMSGAPVVMHVSAPGADLGGLPWKLLGVHSSRLDIGTRDLVLDEALGLNCAWYPDVLLAATAE